MYRKKADGNKDQIEYIICKLHVLILLQLGGDKVAKRMGRWTINILTALFAVSITISIMSLVNSYGHPGEVPSAFGVRFMSVLSGSMEPAIRAGDMVVIKYADPDQIKSGDVITYMADEDFYITHRVVGISYERGKRVFRTKGDANNTDDEDWISFDTILGAVKFKVPYGGYAVQFIKGPAGLIGFLILPSSFLIYEEIKTIISAVKSNRENKDGGSGIGKYS